MLTLTRTQLRRIISEEVRDLIDLDPTSEPSATIEDPDDYPDDYLDDDVPLPSQDPIEQLDVAHGSSLLSLSELETAIDNLSPENRSLLFSNDDVRRAIVDNIKSTESYASDLGMIVQDGYAEEDLDALLVMKIGDILARSERL